MFPNDIFHVNTPWQIISDDNVKLKFSHPHIRTGHIHTQTQRAGTHGSPGKQQARVPCRNDKQTTSRACGKKVRQLAFSNPLDQICGHRARDQKDEQQYHSKGQIRRIVDEFLHTCFMTSISLLNASIGCLVGASIRVAMYSLPFRFDIVCFMSH